MLYTLQKTQAEPRRTGKSNRQTDPNRNDDFSNVTTTTTTTTINNNNNNNDTYTNSNTK